jgi:threonine synthase
VTAAPGIFRHAARLPIEDTLGAISLGEGDTPLVDVSSTMARSLNGARVSIKCESANPTGSFKDRIAAVALTLVRERGLAGCVGTSSGNGGASMAAYSARAGVPATVFALTDTAPQKLLQIAAAGGRVVRLAGLGHDAEATDRAADAIASAALRRGYFPFITARRFSPEAMEGAKTIAFELAEQAPDATVIYIPIGGGGLYSAIGRGYREIESELASGPPRLVAVQPAGCATIARVLRGESALLDRPVETTISGLQVASLFDSVDVVETLAAARGHLVEVSDDQVWEAQAMLAREQGLLVEPAGATALAGAIADAASGRLAGDDRVIALATGAGWKDTRALERVAGAVDMAAIAVDELAAALDELLGVPRD